MGDERFVPPDHPESNEYMVHRVLLGAVQPRSFHSMYRAGSIADAADAYDALVREASPIDLVHLGLGPDGHTASLFPGTPALDVQDRFVVINEDAEHPHPRLTFTYPAIATARLVVVTVAGEEKRDAMQRIANGEDLPAARIGGEHVLWIVDDAAAP